MEHLFYNMSPTSKRSGKIKVNRTLQILVTLQDFFCKNGTTTYLIIATSKLFLYYSPYKTVWRTLKTSCYKELIYCEIFSTLHVTFKRN